MVRKRLPRDRQRGNSLVLALIVMSALATLGSLTVVSVQSSLKASTNDRSQSVALYAAETGVAFTMEFLRTHEADDWSLYYTVAGVPNVPAFPGLAFQANQSPPGKPGNPFSADQNAWFDVQIRRGGDGATDAQKQVVIRSTGHGPQESVAVVEWEVKLVNLPPQPPDPAGPTPGFPHAFISIGWHVLEL
jgi:hypothetical protein